MARGWCLLLAILHLVCPAAAAALQAPPLTGYSLAAWTERDGLPLGVVRAIVQDGDGYLWLGTSSGLLRFDGVRFSTAASLGFTDLPTNTVRALLRTPDGVLWVGFDDRAGVWAIGQGRAWRPGRVPLNESVGALAQDVDGRMWAATGSGVFELAGDRWHQHRFEGGQDAATGALYVDRNGTLWAGTSRGLFRRAGGTFNRVGASTSTVRSITEDATGRIWVSDPAVGFRGAEDLPPERLDREASGIEVFADHGSNLWIGTAGQGVWRVRPDVTAVARRLEMATVNTGLVSNGVWVAFEDRERNIWLGTQLGLNRLTPHTATPVVDIGVVRAVEPGDFGVWAGTAGSLLHLATGAGTVPPRVTRVANADVVALHRDGAGVLWVASTAGLARLDGGQLVPVTSASSLHDIRAIAHTAAGLWVADGAGGLFRLRGGRFVSQTLPPHLASRQVRFIHGDGHDRLWLAFTDGTLSYIDRNLQVLDAGPGEGFADGTHATLDAIGEDQQGSVWIGGNGGLTRFRDGQFVSMSSAGGLPGNRVTAVAADPAGHLWLAIDGGVVRLHPDEFERAVSQPGYRMRHTRLDTSRGLGGIPVGTANERVARTADGQLWFATGWGVTRLDPAAEALHEPAADLPALIEGIVVNDTRIASADGVALPAGTTTMRVDYTAVRLATPTRIRFRYRLEGFDAAWVDAGTRRQAFYTNLAPGSYRFVVQAEGGDRSWTNSSDTWSFTVEPAFVQTRTFLSLIVFGLLLSAWGAWQIRLRHVRRQFGLILGERARLSREIHDTLLQNLAGVAIQCAGISNALDASSPARAQLNAVRRQVESYVRDMRQAVWDLRAPALETHDLGGALREFGAHATAGTAMTFGLAVVGKPRRLAAKVENDVLRVGQEAIRNAIRHSHATHIRVELAFERNTLTLCVSDNGRGFDFSHQAYSERHCGLIGMRERASELGGRLNIARPPSGGTNVELIVPADLRAQEA